MRASLVLCGLAMWLGACKDTDGPLAIVPITGIDVSPATEAVAVHDTLRLTARVFTTGNVVIEGASVEWSTSDPAIAIVDRGVVRALTEGTVSITARADSFAGTVSVNVYRMLSFTSDRSGNFDIYGMSKDGRYLRALMQTDEYEANGAWSPDGTRIAFARGNRLVIMDGDGTNPVVLATASGSPTWSPDGRKLAFVSLDQGQDQEIHVVNVDGTGRANISRSPGIDRAPSWSPDGSKIVFVSYRDGGSQLYTMKPDGTSLQKLTSIPDSHNLDPAWSPDGSRIAFVSAVTGEAGGWGIYTIDPDGKNRRRIGGSLPMTPAWSPDGASIAFIDLVNGQQDLYIMNADGTNVRQLTDDAALDMLPAWR